MFSAAVLAGGQSRRFGQDKARFVFRGRPLIEWVLESLCEARERVIVANRAYPEFGLPVLADVKPGGDALSGVYTALYHAQQEWVAVAACDLPFLSRDYWRLLLEHTWPGIRLVAGVSASGFVEPLAALYHRSLLEDVERRLSKGRLRLQSLFEEHPSVSLPWEGLEARFGPELFLNANQIEDLPQL
ncbi:molybdenum cofactor guanylyltransferase [Calidithermus roseus]|uniref:Probable molybdenum cofactor guanylyltransferase n=1 Tax=Calidithermus roseus TaxID=1644118 RepID=A0A399F006_9DEIN|nr:molybdenum cofactor guanylyltransferase [Calidithermus roseus]RIH89618.1 putative molybdenum cofactor guanylyltransferase [Calidithermus roseus]